MKKILFLFLLACGLCSGQTITFPPGKLASEEYVRIYIRHIIDSLEEVRKNRLPPDIYQPPIIPVKPPIIIGSLKPCEAGPEIRTISAITEQGLQVLFHGVNVFGLDWQILKDGTTQRSGKITPTGSTVPISYETLSAGTYTLRLSGNTCTGASTREFTIERFSGQTNPPKVPEGDPAARIDADNLAAGYYYGISIPNGNVQNHIDALNFGIGAGYNTTIVTYGNDNTAKDTDWDIANWSAYDHTASPTLNGSGNPVYAHAFDRVIRGHYLAGKKVLIRLPLARSWRELNGEQSGQSVFWAGTDSHMREDGTTPTYKKHTSVVPNEANPSLATTAVKEYAKGLLYRFMKRYAAALNSGVILAVGLTEDNNAEAQLPIHYKEADGSTDVNLHPKGDFNPAAIARFKALFPAYASESNTNIANAGYNTNLGRDFYWHEADMLREIEWNSITYATTMVPSMTRSKWYMIDAGSYADGLTQYRRTFNLQARIRSEYLVIKTNDAPDAPHGVDYARSAAIKISGIPFHEPTSQGNGYSCCESALTTSMTRSKNGGVSISLIGQVNQNDHTPVVNASGIKSVTSAIVPTSTVNLTLNLSDIIAGGQSYIISQWSAIRASSGKEYVNFTVNDNVKPSHLIRAPR